MAKKPTKAPKAKAAKSNGKAQTFSPEAKITVLAKENPKRKGTAEFKRFAKYKSGMTVAAAKELGIANNLNLTIDVQREYIKVGG
jgi:hypothetical protein